MSKALENYAPSRFCSLYFDHEDEEARGTSPGGPSSLGQRCPNWEPVFSPSGDLSRRSAVLSALLADASGDPAAPPCARAPGAGSERQL